MSRPPKRKTKPAQARARREPAGGGTPSPTPIFQAALQGARGIHATDDPLQVEVFVSDLLGLFDRPLIDVRDPVDFFGRRLVTYLVGKRSPDALALLHGIVAVADEPLADAAATGVARLRAGGRADPTYAERIGRHRFVDAWASIDEYGDQEMVGVSFVDPADQRHALAFMIDHNFDGLVREAFLAPDLEDVRTSWVETSGMTIVPLDAQALADRLGQGLAMFDLFLDPPCSDEVRELAVLMKARLRALPPAREPERREVDDDEREALAIDFAKAKEAGRSAVVAEVARYFIDYRFDHTDGDPLRWSPIAVEMCLLDWFPRKVTLDDDELAAVPDALRRLVRYAGRRKGLSRDLIAETLAAVEEFEPPFRAAMRDETRFGPAKSMVAAMLGAGIDLGDPGAVSGWIEAFNGRPLEERDALLRFLGGGAADDDDDADADEPPERGASPGRSLRVLPGGLSTPVPKRLPD